MSNLTAQQPKFGDSDNTLLLKIATLVQAGAYSPAIDPAASAYFASAGITDATQKTNINAFVVGMKALVNWSKFTCWILRDGQNAGTGTTAYSLGGLGNYNGTLTNGPTWGTNGVRRPPGLAAHIVIPSINVWTPDADSLGAVFKINAHPNGLQFAPVRLGQGGASNISGVAVLGIYTDNLYYDISRGSYEMTSGDTQRVRQTSGGGTIVADGNWHAMQGAMGPAAAFARTFYFDRSSVGADGGTGTARSTSTDSGKLIAAQDNNSNYDATLAMAYAATEAYSGATQQAIYDLYKTTIGQGLNLFPTAPNWPSPAVITSNGNLSSPVAGDTLTANGSAAVGNFAPTITYEWEMNVANSAWGYGGSSAQTFVVPTGLETAYRCVITATNSGGSAASESNSSGQTPP